MNLSDSSVVNIRNQFKNINHQSGIYKGSKLLKQKSVGENDLEAFIYFVKYERNYYRFTFIFYNNGDVSRLYKFYFDDNIVAELEESLKFYN